MMSDKRCLEERVSGEAEDNPASSETGICTDSGREKILHHNDNQEEISTSVSIEEKEERDSVFTPECS